MITKSQAEAIVKATQYRDWVIEMVDPGQLTVWEILGQITYEMAQRVCVNFTYTAADSRLDFRGETVTNVTPIAIPLTETEVEFARALYEGICLIEEHERREFFTVGLDVVKDRPYEARNAFDPRGWDTRKSGGQKEALFHPHGINRNKLFHDLDQFASNLRLDALTGKAMTSDAV
jgi:hypothetical protein